MENLRAAAVISEVHRLDRNSARDRRHRDVGGLHGGLLRGPVDHIGGQLEIPGLDLELLPGLHQLDHGAGDFSAHDAEANRAPMLRSPLLIR